MLFVQLLADGRENLFFALLQELQHHALLAQVQSLLIEESLAGQAVDFGAVKIARRQIFEIEVFRGFALGINFSHYFNILRVLRLVTFCGLLEVELVTFFSV